MILTFRALSRNDAESVVRWHYEGEYSIYDTPPDHCARVTEYMLDRQNGFWGVFRDEELVGFCSIGLDGRVPGGPYDDSAVDLGAGLRPDLVGQGNGISFLQSVVQLAESITARADLRTTIAKWNHRAIRTACAVGFIPSASFRDSNGRDFTVFVRRQNK